ncbi:hypothetical protein F5879DRAFT_950856 [Lentinula edodes]|uniref:uncharacterized protein n=1 Tax=Lentinula edodes TaxID=5353 RepID=UPI001E8E9CAD|nr:uncharacterized protein C8R40DRAFT_382054 [Lentinula edodes]KAH7873353.1 hypothetical protein C8R40DRAFT_382054 [Lentinula edodes]KAJ3905413.1 hypothetical protein F5879DRAFT_950856 [Lentinula edodes]
MADRLSQYTMGHNFVPGAAGMHNHHQLSAMQQQQQLQPGQQQQQESSQQPHPGLSGFNDQNRAWSQMQQMQQMRAQNGQDMNGPSAQQMADLLRSQKLAQMQSQQQRFGLSIGGSGQSQQTTFLDQPNPSQHNMQMGFTGLGQHNPSYQQSMQHRQSMLQTLQGNQQHSRQLELMNLAQNQQNQNSPTNLGNRGVSINGAPQGLNPLQSQNDMFPAPNDMRRPSPHPSMPPSLLSGQPANTNGMVQNSRGTVNVQGRTINLGDLTERATTLRSLIQSQEMQMLQLQAQRTNMPDNMFMARMRSLQSELVGRKESLNKIVTLMNICMQQGNGTNGPINITGGSSQGPPPPGNGGQPWQSSPFGNPTQPPSQPQPAGLGPRSSPAPTHPQSGLSVNSPSNVPPRSGPTPQQSMNSFPMNTSPLNFPINNPPTNGATGPNISGAFINAPIPPLDKSRFESSYKQWCLTKAIVHDPRLLAIDNRQIDLFQLHCLVMREGGLTNVTRKELWPVIAGRLGMVNFPGEPPRSGPVAAMHIQNVYKEYLLAFDTVYITSVVDSRRKSIQTPGQFPPQGPSMPFTPEALRSLSPHQLRMIIACADKSPSELRARGMSDTMISFVETHRSSLQSMSADQENFGNEIRRPQLPQGPMAGNVGHAGNVGQPFPNLGNTNQPFRPPGEPQPTFPPGSSIPRPSREQLSLAQMTINRNKAEYTARALPLMPGVDIPLESRGEYNSVLELAFRLANELDGKLALYSIVTKNEENTKKLSNGILSVQHQRSLLTSPNPKFIISFENLRTYSTQFQYASRYIAHILQNIFRGDSGPTVDQHPSYPGPVGRVVPSGQLPPNLQHSPAPNLPTQSNNSIPPRPPMPLNPPPPPSKNKKQSGAPTPPASAATPIATAPTPSAAAAASPQTPKSPKPKSAPKKPKSRKPSTPKVNATPTLDHATIPTSSAGVKRPREEELDALQPSTDPSAGSSSNPLPTTVANEPSPPKRAKTDWEGPISESLQKKNQVVENIKTEEDASQFLEQMTELIKMAGTEDQAALSSDISETLEQILKGYDGGIPDSDTFSTLGLNEVGSLDASASTSQILSSNDLTEFFDFSLFPNEDEDESKVGTPDLVSSSSTNPSPESQADADPAHHATALLDVKQEEYDPLRLGTLKEIDGGESAYYQSTDWKWDGHMATLEQPWAIFNS